MSYTDLLKLKQPQKLPPQGEGKRTEWDASPLQNINPPSEMGKTGETGDPASPQAITQAGYHDSMIALLRKTVKTIGKDAFFGRFTAEEKGQLADVVYLYKRKGIKTSENEIARIAINFVMADYRENGEKSLLERVLKALQE